MYLIRLGDLVRTFEWLKGVTVKGPFVVLAGWEIGLNFGDILGKPGAVRCGFVVCFLGKARLLGKSRLGDYKFSRNIFTWA